MRRSELKHEVQSVEELERRLFAFGARWLDEITRRSRRSGLAEKCRQRLSLVAGLYSLHLVQIARIEQLCAVDAPREIGFRADHFLHAGGGLARPARPGDEIVAAVVAGCAAADIVE